VLFDRGTPKPLRRSLHGAYERGWSTLANGELITQAEAAGFDILVTTDRQEALDHAEAGSYIEVAIP